MRTGNATATFLMIPPPAWIGISRLLALWACTIAAVVSAADAIPKDRPARGGGMVWADGSRGIQRQSHVVVACEPMDLDIRWYAGPDGRRKHYLYFTPTPLPEQHREAWAIATTTYRIAWDPTLAKRVGLSDEQVKTLRKLPMLGGGAPVARDEAWKPGVEAQYVAWEAASANAATDPLSLEKARADLIAKVKEAGAGVLARQIEGNATRSADIAALLTPQQMDEYRKVALEQSKNWAAAAFGSRPAKRLEEGVWRHETFSLMSSHLRISAVKRNNTLATFWAAPVIALNSDLYALENALTYLASHPDMAKSFGVSREQIGQLRSFALDSTGIQPTDKDLQRLRQMFEAWDKTEEPDKQTLESALLAMATEVGEDTETEYRKAERRRIEEIQSALGTERIEKIRKAILDEQYRRMGGLGGEVARPETRPAR